MTVNSFFSRMLSGQTLWQRKHYIALCGLIVSFVSSALQTVNAYPASPLNSQLLNADWQYLQKDWVDVEQALVDKAWQSVALPHSWNATDTVDALPGYRRSASWYKKVVQHSAPTSWRTVLYFEGANFVTKVYVNGQYAGGHVGGYVGFEVDISAFLHKGDNDILVRVDNDYDRNLIPSQKADFFLYGGITRDVWLRYVPPESIEQVLISTPTVSHESATTRVQVSVSQQASKQSLTLLTTLFDPDGTLVSQQSTAVTASQFSLDLASIQQPKLWSPDSPNLYQMQLELKNARGQIVHTAIQHFGYRWFEMRPNQGFFVNGERLLIRGTHRHEESAGIGPALSNAQHWQDMQMIKDMGANFVRLGHYPQDPEVYRAADVLGLILWDELPWCRGGKGGKEWEDNTERLLKEQIIQNYNHASIAFWSLGNEMYWEEDFPGGGDESQITPYLSELNRLTKALDPSRLTSIRKYYPGDKIVDAFSPSIWAGWYGGSYSQYAKAIESSMAKYPHFLHMEYGGSSHVGRHSENPISAQGMRNAQVSVDEAMNQAVVSSVAKDSDWNENYMVNLFDWHLQVSENTPNFAGNAQWAFKDFGTPLRPENPIPYMNQKGLVDREGQPKDAYYVFKSYWAKDPFCYIESHTWTHRQGPATGRPVKVYCNTEQAELWLNGESLGRITKDKHKVPAGGLVWQVPFVNGQNKLKVLAYNAGKRVAEDALDVHYLVGEHGNFDHIKLSASELKPGHWLITAEALDKNNQRVLNYAERVYFSNLGSHGQLLENYGTPTKSSIIEMASGVARIEFISGEQPATLEFRSQNIKGTYIEIAGQGASKKMTVLDKVMSGTQP
jgi:beta-galactosidase